MAADIFPIQPIDMRGIIRLSLAPVAETYRDHINTFLNLGKFQSALERELRQLTDSFQCKELKIDVKLRPNSSWDTVQYNFQIQGDLKLQKPLFNIIPTTGASLNLCFDDYLGIDDVITLTDQAVNTALFAAEETFLKNKEHELRSWDFLEHEQHMFDILRPLVVDFLDESEPEIIRTCIPWPKHEYCRQKRFDVIIINDHTLTDMEPSDRSTAITVINEWFNKYKETADVSEEEKKLVAAILTNECQFPITHGYNEMEITPLWPYDGSYTGRDEER